MEKVDWRVTGMTCTNCALTITKYLQKEGVKNINVNFIGGDVSFELDNDKSKQQITNGIEGLGYKIITDEQLATAKHNFGLLSIINGKWVFKNHFQRFIFCLPFTAVLMLHMLPWHLHFLMNPWVQLFICLPVFLLGMHYFGVSAIKSLHNGIANMNMLITIGSLAAFVYSLMGTIKNLGMNYVFYETTATIITLIFLGEWIESKAIYNTQKELNKLSANQKVMANMIAFDDKQKELIFSVENNQLHIGDLILIKTGEQVPTDCKILWGEAFVSEALLTGENKPIYKQKKDNLVGGSLFTSGAVKAQVTAVGKNTVLGNILNLVKQAQSQKPPIQQFADKISAVFVPAVIAIAILSFLINYFGFAVSATTSLMRSIAVLVISCPCAMGLATPAAIAVGLGRATKNGILFRNAKSLELFKNIKTIVFDKTGTLTNGEFKILNFDSINITKEEFKQIVFSLEKYSNHPIAKAINVHWKINNPIRWKKIEEIKGKGLKAEDWNGNIYTLGNAMESFSHYSVHTASLYKNNVLLGWFNVDDDIRNEAKSVIDYLHNKKIKTILLSGDTLDKCNQIATTLNIDEVYAQKTPEEKLKIIEQLNTISPVAMIGDGINDAPALAKATIGISIANASQIAMQTAQVVLTNNGIKSLPLSLGLGKQTFITIKQNLFWAFAYNIVVIPMAAMGYLHPAIAALAMGCSDVVLAINSVHLNYKKIV